MALAACGATTNSSSTSSGSSTAAKGGKQGGSMTVVLNSGYDGAWPAGLDPVTNTNGAANQSLMNSIYGQLIELARGRQARAGPGERVQRSPTAARPSRSRSAPA